MAKVFFTADTHFNHQAMITKGWRPFSSVEEMNEKLISRWNGVVGKRDQVWHLGDYAMGNEDDGLALLSRLNGEIHLITGNHDQVWPKFRNSHVKQRKWLEAGFSSIQPFARRKVAGQSVMLSHFPYQGDHTSEERYDQYRLRDPGTDQWLLCGHVHDLWSSSGRQINVGVDVRDWAPVPLEDIEYIIGSR